MQHNTAILVFSRSARAEQRHKLMHRNAAKNLQIHQVLYNKTIDTVRETNIPFIVLNESRQHGNTFGEVFCNAMEYCFELGYSNLITIGSDCLNLSSGEIISAAQKLQQGVITIGADHNNGFYLLALNRKNYSRITFLNFKWRTHQLFKNISTYFTSVSAPLSILQSKADVNTAADLKSVLKELTSSPIIKLLRSCFISTFRTCHLKSYIPQLTVQSIFCLRGPPQVAIF